MLVNNGVFDSNAVKFVNFFFAEKARNNDITSCSEINRAIIRRFKSEKNIRLLIG